VAKGKVVRMRGGRGREKSLWRRGKKLSLSVLGIEPWFPGAGEEGKKEEEKKVVHFS